MAKQTLTYDLVHKYFSYNPTTGKMYWRIQKGPRNSGEEVASYAKGYIVVCFGYTRYSITHIIWLLQTGKLPKSTIDHKNGVRDDNRWCNLREASPKDQQGNQPLYKNNTSGYRGVSFQKDKNRWRARLHKGGKEIFLGLFKTKKEADIVFRKHAKEYFGKFYRDLPITEAA